MQDRRTQDRLDPVARTLATWFGCGRSPLAPGTVGALGTIPLHLLLKALGPGAYLAGTLATTAAGIWAADRTARATGKKDPQEVVIDEVSGTLIAMGLLRGRGFRAELLSLLLFRVLDVLKPGFIDTAQRAKPAGVGIMADDVLAGLLAGLIVRGITR